jgi:hypothetical protein
MEYEPLVMDLLEGFKMVLNALVIGRVLGIALSVYGFLLTQFVIPAPRITEKYPGKQLKLFV